jgi:hypothetical protein
LFSLILGFFPQEAEKLLSCNKGCAWKSIECSLLLLHHGVSTAFVQEFFNLLHCMGTIYTCVCTICSLQVALIPYLTAGDPDLDTTAEAMQVLDMCGCDIIELGVPYSDPLADGPVIQVCCCVAFSFLSFEIAPSLWFL